MLPSAGGALLPLGGTEETAGYKGYGLGMFVELLCGVLPAAATGPDVQPWKPDRPRPIDYGHCFIAIDPSRFEDGSGSGPFDVRLKTYLDQMRRLPTVPDAPGPVLIPGDLEAASMARTNEVGVTLSTKVAASVNALARKYGVTLPKELEAVTVSAPKDYRVR